MTSTPQDPAHLVEHPPPARDEVTTLFARALAGDDAAHLAPAERVFGHGDPDPQAVRALGAVAEMHLAELDRDGSPVPELTVAEFDQHQAQVRDTFTAAWQAHQARRDAGE